MTKAKPNALRRDTNWRADVLPVARAIVESYNTGVTLRQLFYRLVSLPLDHPARLPNQDSYYARLAARTAGWRRDGYFPDLVDPRREILGGGGFTSPQEYLRFQLSSNYYRRNHSEGQPYQIWLGVEKAGLVNQLSSWFRDLGLRIIALGGQCSQPYVDEITRAVRRDGRPALLWYAGDHDPTGWSILQSFVDRCGYRCWSNPELPEWNQRQHRPKMRRYISRPILDRDGYDTGRIKYDVPNFNRYRKFRVALTPEQCDRDHPFALVRNSAKEKDINLPNLLANFADTLTDDEFSDGLGVQVEVDALDPNDLRDLFTRAIEQHWDGSAWEASKAQEREDIAELDRIIDGLGLDRD